MDEWNKVCRACLTTKESFTYFLFKNVSPETYLFCTSVEVQKDEKLPKAICSSCHELLKRYSEFKQTCIQSQNSLLSLYCSQTLKGQSDVTAAKGDVKLKSELGTLRNVTLNSIENEETKLKFNSLALKEEDVSDQYNDDVLLPVEFVGDVIEKKVKVHKRKNLAKSKRRRAKDEVQNTKRKVLSKPASFTYSCEFCPKRFRNHLIFEAHKLEHEGRKMSFHCMPCNKAFLTWSGLRRHKESAHEPVRLQRLACGACGRLCASRQSLRAHEGAAHGPRAPCVCHVCGRRVASALILRTHLETHKADRERAHTCEHCGKKFFTNTMLNTHISRQHTGRRFICAHCSYPFTDKYNLAKHLLIHDGKKLFKCDICSKSYASKSTLVEHKRIHSGERPFACSYCPKSFVSKRRLTDHVRIHTGVKPHKCCLCEQRFTQRGTLQRHMKVHVKAVTTNNRLP